MEITFLPVVKKVICEKTVTLMEVMLEQNIPMDFVCGGQKRCGKCKVLVSKGNDRILSDAEKQFLTQEEVEKGYRLACCFLVQQDCCIILEAAVKQVSFLESNRTKENSVETNEFPKTGGKVKISFDIGTTTVEALFMDETNTVLERITRVNPQRVYGLDVISRISYGMKSSQNQQKLKHSIIGCFNTMIQEGLSGKKVAGKNVTDIVVMGNTTMISILLGRPIEKIGKASFENDFHGLKQSASSFGISVAADCELFVPGFIGGHVGSDTLGCILQTEIWKDKGVSLIVDIGTNGEIVLSKNGMLSACSTAAGPAFEGANIVNGMRAGKGAIYTVKKDEISWTVETVGDETPVGICGSGLIDAACVFLQLGRMDATGRLDAEWIALDSKGKVKLYQEDIRQLQLAKSAILSGIESLLSIKNTKMEEVQTIYLAGAFGSGLNIKNAMGIGLLPKVSPEKYVYIGNGSLDGGCKIVSGQIIFEKALQIAESVEHVELANSEEFKQKFIEHLNF